MTTLWTHAFRHNDRAPIAYLDVNGAPGLVFAKRGKGRTGSVGIMIKVGNEKQFRITDVRDDMPCTEMPSILEEYIATDFVTSWAPACQLETHA